MSLNTGAWGLRKEEVGEGVGRKGWRRVGEGLADFLAPSNFGIPQAPVWRHGFVTPWLSSGFPLKTWKRPPPPLL